jgi:hypothetical protein
VQSHRNLSFLARQQIKNQKSKIHCLPNRVGRSSGFSEKSRPSLSRETAFSIFNPHIISTVNELSALGVILERVVRQTVRQIKN